MHAAAALTPSPARAEYSWTVALFCALMRDAIKSASSDWTRRSRHLCAVYLDGTNAVTTDGHRMAVLDVGIGLTGSGSENTPIAIPRSAIEAMLSALRARASDCLSRQTVRIEVDHSAPLPISIRCAAIGLLIQTEGAGIFPPWRACVPADGARATTRIRLRELRRAVRRAGEESVEIQIAQDGSVTLGEEAAISPVGDISTLSARVVVSVRYLLEACQQLSGHREINLSAQGRLDPIMLRAGDDIAVIMPRGV